MGSSQSKVEAAEKVFRNETPIQFSEEVVNHLSDLTASPEASHERQTSLDFHIRTRIQAELQHLREEEETVRAEIERALEKENLDRERSMAGQTQGYDEASGAVKSSAVLMGDLEEIRSKMDCYQRRRELSDLPSLQASGEAVVSCYKKNPLKPLKCWQEVTDFKTSVARAEQEYFTSLR